MRLVPKPGGTIQQFRAMLFSQPFDLTWGAPVGSTGTPEDSFVARIRGDVFTARNEGRGAVFTPRVRGDTWLARVQP
jgi:hypothetical protein